MALRFAAPLHASPHRPPCAAARRAIQCSTCNLSTKLNRAAVNSKDSQNQFQHNLIVNSPSMLTKNPKLIRPVAVKSAFVLSSPIVSPTDHWGTWTVLFATAAFGYCCNHCWHCSGILFGANAVTWSRCMEDSCSSHG
uniref:Uncharacterized protein n=1 Tax=Opuntia streptacantha TaxID=393608 RepID=A0A7C9CZ04_OPUST